MEQPWAFHVFDVAQHFYKLNHVMSVHRPEITYVKTFKNVLFLRHERLHRVAESNDGPFSAFCENPFFSEKSGHLVAYSIVARRGCEVGKITMQSTDIVVDTHVIVV